MAAPCAALKPSSSKARTRSRGRAVAAPPRLAAPLGRRLPGHQRRRDHGHAQRHPQHGETGAQPVGGQAPPGDGDSACGRTRYRPSSARRMISGRASWSVRRPSWIVVQDLAVADDQHAIGVGGGPRLMGHQHDGLAQLDAGAGEELEDLRRRWCSPGSRSAHRPAGGRAGCQRAGQRHPLLLAGGELIRARARPWRSGPPCSSSSSTRALAARQAVPPPIRKGRATFSRTVSSGMRLKNWNTNPVLCAAGEGRLLVVEALMFTPSITTSPPLGLSSPPSRWRSVDLPDPDAPMMARNSPRSTAEAHPAEGVDLGRRRPDSA